MPAARVADMHSCPMVSPGPVPHVGGPILAPGDPTVLILGLPAARVTDWATCAGPIDVIACGAARTMIGQAAAAPPAPPAVTPAGGGSPSWFYQHEWFASHEYAAWSEILYAHDFLLFVQVYSSLSFVAGVVGVVAVAVVVYPYVSRSGELPAWPEPPGDSPNLLGDVRAFREQACQEGVRDDAEMYFLR
jgi:uncharacterized Zn-binding protein involved in type VI secretion